MSVTEGEPFIIIKRNNVTFQLFNSATWITVKLEKT